MIYSSPTCSCPGRGAAALTRRQLLRDGANGFGALALSALLADRAFTGERATPAPHFKPRAKNVIFLFMDGGVSHIDTFDPKPKLAALDGKPSGKSDNPTANHGDRKWLKSPWSFRRYGKSGLEVSELFPHVGACADDLAVIRSMKVDLPLHPNGVLFLHTGHTIAGRPSLGSWLNYGLGSVNQNLPGFVVLNFGNIPMGGMENFSSGFLPASHQGTILRADGTPIDNIVPADRNRVQRAKLDLLRQQDGAFSHALGEHDAVESSIRNYETAYRMQVQVPDVLDLNKESAATRKLYGLDAAVKSKQLYGTQCLRARRLVEAGVRFIEVNCPSEGPPNGVWDQHGGLKTGHEKNAFDTDQAIAGLITDLKQRGLLGETLVLWAGEFGRSPHAAGRDGRDHHHEGFTVWMAGGGVRPGTVHGATDELGMKAVENPVGMHDLHATLLHLLGLDHTRLTFRSGGRDFRLTDVAGEVVQGVLA